jgi:phage replication O-like protein O
MKEARDDPQACVTAWELTLIAKVAATFRTSDREDLKAELARKVLAIKAKPLIVSNWKAYLSKLLYNKAANWVRDERGFASRIVHWPHAADEETSEPNFGDHLSGPREPHDLRIALEYVKKDLDPELRRVWNVLLEENGNQSSAAARLQTHRNTIRLKISQIRETLRRHGFNSPHDSHCAPSVRRVPPMKEKPKIMAFSAERFVQVPTRVLEGLLRQPLSGTQCRIILWVLRQTYGWHRQTTRFTWYGIARQLSMDRPGVARAGRSLIDAKLLQVDADRICVGDDNNQMSGVTTFTRDKQHPNERRTSPFLRQAKDSSKERIRNSHPAGAAKPISGKYDRLSQL